MHPDAKYIAINLTGIPRLLNLLYRKRPLILAYHGIYDGPRRPESLPPTFIHVEDLKAQLKAIKRRYRILTPDQFVCHVFGRKPFPYNSALITFDDGYESFDCLAVPVLERLGLRCIVFVATWFMEESQPFWFDIAWLYAKALAGGHCKPLTDHAGVLPLTSDKGMMLGRLKRMTPEKRDPLIKSMQSALKKCSMREFNEHSLFYPLNSQQLKSLITKGFSVGGHTHTHTILTSLSEQKAWEEIYLNKTKIEKITGHSCKLFAYPNGDIGNFSAEHKKKLAKAGYVAAFSLTQRRTKLLKENPMEISRINVAQEDSILSLLFHSCGAVPIMNLFKMDNATIENFTGKMRQQIKCGPSKIKSYNT